MKPYILKIIFSIYLASILIFPLSACQSPKDLVRVTQVIDGDTIVIADGSHVRYIGMDTPEQGQPYYLQALQLNKELVSGKFVRLESDVSDKDKYGRLLRYVYVSGIFVNAEIVRHGYARAHAYPPDTKYQVYIQSMESEARNHKAGIWSKVEN
jgi:micrococcal nuclease